MQVKSPRSAEGLRPRGANAAAVAKELAASRPEGS